MKRPDTARRGTLQDIADAVGVSVNTVSRALNDRPGVSEATRSAVKAEAARISYVPNASARSLVLGSRRTIAVVVGNLSNPYFTELVSEIEYLAGEAGFAVLLLLSDEDSEGERRAVDAALAAGVDGIICVPVQAPQNPWEGVVRAGVPLVLTTRQLPELEQDFIAVDSELGGYRTAKAALDQGARNPVLLEEDLRVATPHPRIAGFRRALEESDVDPDADRVVFVPSRRGVRGAMHWRAEDGYRVVMDLLESGHRPDSFLVGNDYFALGAYKALAEHGVRIPDDALVLGWGDYAFSRFLTPPLASLRLPSARVAQRAVQRLFERIDGTGPTAPVTDLIPPDLVLRASAQRVS